MPTVVYKLFARQGTGRMDGQTKRQLYASPFGEHKNQHMRKVKKKTTSNKITLEVNAASSFNSTQIHFVFTS